MLKKINYKIIPILFLVLLFGCAKRIDEAKDYAEKSRLYYQKAIEAYKTSRDHFNLGMLYYAHGDYALAIEEFKAAGGQKARKFLGISYYKSGNYTDALEILRQLEPWDDAEFLYYYGLSSERLNLFDQALTAYNKIKGTAYKTQALERVDIINRSRQKASLNDLDEDTRNLILNAPEGNAYPQAGALILKCEEHIEISPENTLAYTGRYCIKILNERGKEDFSEVQTEYDSTFEKIELEYARLIKPDGEVVYVGQKHIRDVSKYLNFPLYSNVRVHIISVPEITEGAVLDYKIKIYRNQLVNKKDFSTSYTLQTAEPIISCRFNISIPESRRLNIKLINQAYNIPGADLNPKVSLDKNKKVYAWEFKNIPQIIPEPQMPALSEVNPTMLISTFNSWDEVYQWWWVLAKDKMKAGQAIKDKVTQLTLGLKTEREKAQAIYNFCAKAVRYVAVEYGQAGHEPHPASEIFRNKYGDCKDKAILLVTMLKEAGLKAHPVLISTKDENNLEEDFPTTQFNHAIAAVELEGNYIFLDATAETCSFGDLPAGDQARKVLVFKDDGCKIMETPLLPAKNNLIQEELKIQAGRDGLIAAEKKVLTAGFYDQGRRYWLIYTPPKLIEETLKEKIQEVSVGAKLENYNVENAQDLNKPTVLDYKFKGEDYFIIAGDIYILPQLSTVNASLTAKETRRYPIDFDILDRFEKTVQIKVPDNLKIKFMPQSLEKDSPWLKVKEEYSFEAGTIYFKETKELKKISVSLSEYRDFKKFMEDLAKFSKQRVVLEKIK